MNEPREHRFLSTTLFIAGSLLIWIADFTIVYVFAALACARGFADVRVLGLPTVPVVTILSSIVSAIATFVLFHKAALILRDTAASEHSRFIGFVALTTSVLAMIALVLLALPPLIVSACAR